MVRVFLFQTIVFSLQSAKSYQTIPTGTNVKWILL